MKHTRTTWGNQVGAWVMMAGMVVGLPVGLVCGQAWVSHALGLPYGQTRLWSAVVMDDPAQVRRAFCEGASLEHCPDKGVSLLTFAATGCDSRILEELLGRGGEANIPALGDCTLLQRAVLSGRTENVRVLLRHGARLNAAGPGHGWRVLVELADSPLARPEMLEMLIAAEAGLDGPDGEGVAPLHATRRAHMATAFAAYGLELLSTW